MDAAIKARALLNETATAKISFDADRLRKEQEDTAISLQQAAQQPCQGNEKQSQTTG